MTGPYKLGAMHRVLANMVNPTFPVSYSEATISYAEDDGDDRFLPGEVLQFEKAAVVNAYQWFGLFDGVFSSQIVAVRFKIKFFNSIPAAHVHVGVRSGDLTENAWLAQCSVGIWCDVHVRINELPNGADHVILIFDGSPDAVKLHIAHFTVTTIQKYTGNFPRFFFFSLLQLSS